LLLQFFYRTGINLTHSLCRQAKLKSNISKRH